MRIALLNKHVRLTGGADRQCLALAQALRENGHEVAFLSTASEDNLEHDGVFVRRTVTHRSRDSLPVRARGAVAASALWNSEAAAAMRHLLVTFRPDVVHAHKLYPQLSVAPIIEAAKSGVPIVQTLHDFELMSASALDARGGWVDRDESRTSYRVLNSLTLPVRRLVHVRRVSAFIAVSRFLAHLFALKGVTSTVLPNFVEAPSDGTALPPFESRSGLVFLGRLQPEKGVMDIVEMAGRLPDVPVTIIGSGSLADRVQESARRLPNLTATGFIPDEDVKRIVRSSRVMVIPSRCHDPGPLVTLEAMGHGTPIVAYATGGLAEYVSDAGCGRIVPSDVAGLTQACTDLHGDQLSWETMSERGLRATVGTHSRARYVEEIERIYAGLVRRHEPQGQARTAS